MKDRFYLSCTRETVGTNMSFHCKDGNGYSTDIDKAHVFTREEIQARWNAGREIDLPVSADHVDALSVYHVDCQRIPSFTQIDSDYYVAFRQGEWNGNDLYWLTWGGNLSNDLDKAVLLQRPGGVPGFLFIPYSVADELKRRTFDVRLFKRRVMIQGAGLKTPEHIKRYRRRQQSSGKVRFNCPCCGRISWQLNPYDFDGCRDIHCEEWKGNGYCSIIYPLRLRGVGG